MKVSGFSFIRNAIVYGYPVLESINSVLPLVDEFVIAVGNSEDKTLRLIKDNFSKKIKIIQTTWDDNCQEGGRVLAMETNKALSHISKDADWAFYIQGDEVIHEKDIERIRQAMLTYKNDSRVDGLLLNYLHFYGSYDYVGASSAWYPHEIRVIKNNSTIYSYKDAQGFRKGNNKKLNVASIEACVYHYGWVREPKKMNDKQKNFSQLYNNTKAYEKLTRQTLFDYDGHVHTLKRFEDSHPKVMFDTIRRKNWTFEYDVSFTQVTFKDRVKRFFKKYFGLNFYYQNYILLKRL